MGNGAISNDDIIQISPILGANRCGCYANSRIHGGFSKTWQINPRCNAVCFRLAQLP